jgi:PAS domain S-box-containing protein
LVRPIALAVAVGIAYFLTARLSLDLMTQPGVAVFWPAAGVASGTVIALGRTAWWPVAIGVIAANIPANLTADRNVLSSSIFSLGDAGEALLVAWLIERSIGSNFSLGRLHHVLALLGAAIVGAAVSGVGGTLGYKLGYNPDDPVWPVWSQWVASDTIGIIAVAPLVIGLVAGFGAPPSRRELVEGVVALIAVAATAGVIIFMLPSDWWETCVAVVLLFPVVLWVVARCQPVFGSAAVFIVSLIFMTTVAFKLGNFGTTAPSMEYSIVSAQITILGTALCAFILSALFTERRQHEAALAESETRLQEALEAGAVTAYEWDASTDLVRRSNNAAKILGFDPEQPLDGKSFFARVHPDDLPRLKSLWSTINRGNPTYSTTYRFLRLDGREIWLQDTSKADFDPAGKLVRIKGMGLDVTERNRAEEHQKTLIAELDHRVKNLLARVAAVVMYTREGGGSNDDFAQALDRRIQSMADAHLLLSESRWQGVDLLNLVEHQLAPYTNKANITIEGPQVALTAVATQAVAMVLHELVTNAVKYGALSRPIGQVAVSWVLRANGGSPKRVMVEWCETGGPPVTAPARSSYGTSLIRDLIPHELGGTAELAFPIEGVRCRVEFPL